MEQTFKEKTKKRDFPSLYSLDPKKPAGTPASFQSDFPSLYSLDPKKATISDVEKCVAANCDPDELDDNARWGAVSYFALRSYNVPLIRYLLRLSKPEKWSSRKGDVPLLSLIKNHGVIEALLDCGFDINETDDKGQTALMLLSKESENLEFVLHLIRRGADIDKEDKNGWNALDYAVRYEKTPEGEHNCHYYSSCSTQKYVVNALFENGAKARRPQTLDALAQSVSSQVKIWLMEEWTDFTEAEVKEALEKDPSNKERIAENGGFLWQDFRKNRDNPFADMDYRTATAADVKKALDKGGEPNDFNGCQFQGAYFLATARDPEAVKYFFKRCPNPELTTEEWGFFCYDTILSRIRNVEIAKIVADNVPETLTELEYGRERNSIGVAAQSNTDPGFIRHLINLGVSVRRYYEFEDEETDGCLEPELLPLEEAVENNPNPEIMRVLLNAGCDIRKKVVLKYLECSDCPSIKKAEILLSTGLFTVDDLLDVLMRSEQSSPLPYCSYLQKETDVRDIHTGILDSPMIINALKSGHSKLIVKFLKKVLKNPNERNSEWNTPLMIAFSAKKDNSFVIRELLKIGTDPMMKNNDGKSVLETVTEETEPANKKCLDDFLLARRQMILKRIEENLDLGKRVIRMPVPENKIRYLEIVPDMSEKPEPDFLLTESFLQYWDEKTVRISFLSPKYVIPSVNSIVVPRKQPKDWTLSKRERKELVQILKEYDPFAKKTNWQKLIRCWNGFLSEKSNSRLPEDLPMPDYDLLPAELYLKKREE